MEKIILCEILSIFCFLIHLYASQIVCEKWDFCTIRGFNFHFIHKILIFSAIVPFLLQRIFCRVFQPYRDEFKNIEQFVESRGFKLETIKIVTQDNYHIIVHRLINPKLNHVKDKEPVILWHGIGGSSYQWLLQSNDGVASDWRDNNNNNKFVAKTDNSLAIALSNHGYDVFLPNSRGNNYSNGHECLDHDKDAKYWDYSLDELIKFDCRATVDKVLEVTKSERINYVGLSIGGNLIYGLLSEYPEYNRKIKYVTCVASTIRFKYSAMINIIPEKYRAHLLKSLIGYLSRNPAIIIPSFYMKIQNYLCQGNIFTNSRTRFGRMVLYLMSQPILFMFGSRKLNYLRAAEIGTHVTIGISRKTIAHILQLNTAHGYQKFDEGSKEVQTYPLEKLNIQRLTLIYSKHDRVIDLRDAKYFREHLVMPNVIMEIITEEHYDHFDLLLGLDTANVVNSKILNSLTD